MIKRIYRFLSILFLGITLSGVMSSACSALDLGMQGVGDYGMWTTETNRQHLIQNTRAELDAFTSGFSSAPGTVPIESKIGLAFMNAMSYVARVLDDSLGHFVIIFITVMYIFWAGLESYRLIQGQADTKKQVEEIVKKGILVTIWVVVLNIGLRDLFMMIVSPIIDFATYLANVIYNSITSIVGTSMPNTCGAIKNYVANNIAAENIMTRDTVSAILCIPATISGFCYTAIGVGFKWMSGGIGGSVFGFLAGLGFVIGFVCLAWKYAFISLGVIADLFLGVMMLPFTAIAETTGKTSYKGMYGEVYNGFVKLFSAESLQKQLGRFINAAVFFVVFSIVIAFCGAMLSGVVGSISASRIPSLDDAGFIGTVLTGALVWYLATKAEEISKKIGGEIDASLGEKTRGYVQEFATVSFKKVRGLFKKK